MTIENDTSVAALVGSAAGGDRAAWAALVDKYRRLIYSVATSNRIPTVDATDVSQTTWLRLVEHVDRLEDPAKVGSWLATTARRESLRISRLAERQRLTWDESELEPRDCAQVDLDAELLIAERNRHLNAAVDQLPPKGARLIRLLMSDDPPSYGEISELLDIPIGSIGPTRARCLRKLRAILSNQDEADVVSQGLVRT